MRVCVCVCKECVRPARGTNECLYSVEATGRRIGGQGLPSPPSSPRLPSHHPSSTSAPPLSAPGEPPPLPSLRGGGGGGCCKVSGKRRKKRGGSERAAAGAAPAAEVEGEEESEIQCCSGSPDSMQDVRSPHPAGPLELVTCRLKQAAQLMEKTVCFVWFLAVRLLRTDLSACFFQFLCICYSRFLSVFKK